MHRAITAAVVAGHAGGRRAGVGHFRTIRQRHRVENAQLVRDVRGVVRIVADGAGDGLVIGPPLFFGHTVDEVDKAHAAVAAHAGGRSSGPIGYQKAARRDVAVRAVGPLLREDVIRPFRVALRADTVGSDPPPIISGFMLDVCAPPGPWQLSHWIFASRRHVGELRDHGLPSCLHSVRRGKSSRLQPPDHQNRCSPLPGAVVAGGVAADAALGP